MSTYIISTALIIFFTILYRRYFPVLGIPCGKPANGGTQTVILDIRDYNEVRNNHHSKVWIPYAYLKRFKEEIPSDGLLHVIARDRLELNLGLRYLLSKGYQVKSYEINNCPCKKEEEK
ncbi:sulfurtransferase [Oceanobacillus sp. Castelsardo]|uniref:sulfurtransferase n=1 Tax=Oceanobacillus sp. Castelsardo TaxID=1851204 RepID=UPI000837D306|nr:sulfurtransferase [Oceanobacillus sp. Castelsardo]